MSKKKTKFQYKKLLVYVIPFVIIGLWLLSRTFAAGTINYVGVDVLVGEGSGMIASRQYPGVYWYMRDGGESTTDKPRNAIYPVKLDSNGKPLALRGTNKFPFNLISGTTNNNWEDIAMDDQNNIWVGDIGANQCGRNDQKIFKVREPDPTTNESVTILASYTFKFPDPASGCNTWNSEAMFWLDGKMYIFAKTSNSPVYRIDLPTGTTGTAKLVRLGTLTGGVSNISVSSLSDDRTRLMVASQKSMRMYRTTTPSLQGDALVKDLISRSPAWSAPFSCGSGCNAFVEGGAFKRNSYEAAFIDEPKKLYYAWPADYGDTSPPPPPPPPVKQCDFNGDGAVGLSDLSRLLTNYGTSVAANTNGDCTGDGLVGLSDLSTLLSRYGK